MGSDLGNQLLMAADLASLAAVALREGNQAEARRLRALALGMSRRVEDTDVGDRLRLTVSGVAPEVRATQAPGAG